MYSFEELKDKFNKFIAAQNIEFEPESLYEPVRYLMNLKGKRIRPVSCLLAANVFTDKIEKAFPVAYSIEMFHNFTLMHDDVMDDADLRRGNQTVHVKYDINTAILSGDLMMIKSYQHLINCCIDLEMKNKLLNLFTETAIEVCEGQQYDMDFEKQDNVSLDDYLLMIKLKTAVLLGGTFKAGALIGGATDEDADHFYKMGLNLGLAFQIQDDLLDIYGTEYNFGKKIGGDIIQKKKTYLYLKTLELADDNGRTVLNNIYNDDSLSPEIKIKNVKKLFDKYNIKYHAESLIDELTENALAHFNSISVEKHKLQEIKKLMDLLLRRSK